MAENFNHINTKMIVLAREARGITQMELAGLLGIVKGTMSKIEAGEMAFNQEHLMQLTKLLKFDLKFFYQEGEILPPNLTYRKRDVVAQKLIIPIEAWINIYRLHIQKLLAMVAYEYKPIPVLSIEEYGTPEAIARKLRTLWKMEKGFVPDMVELLEKQKIIVKSFNFGTERVDGRSILTDKKVPVVFLNKTLLGDRQRFTLAYELGHLVMHLFTSPAFERDVSHEANVFAAEFLMPEKEIREDLKNGKLTMTKLMELKKKWKVSMQAILYRASDLKMVTDNQKRYLLEQFNGMKIRRREPPELDIPKEHPELLRNLITKYRAGQKMNVKELASSFHLSEDEFVERYS